MKKTNEIVTMKAGKAKKLLNNVPKKTARRRYAYRKNLIEQTAKLTGFSEVYVRKVMDCERKSEVVEAVYMELHEGSRKLVNAVKTLLPWQGNQDIELVTKYYPGPEADRLQGETESGT